MRERMGLILKIACYVLAALLLYELRWTVPRLNSLSRVKIPALPVLDSETNSLAGAPISGTARTGTNSSAIGAPIASGLPVRASGAATSHLPPPDPACSQPGFSPNPKPKTRNAKHFSALIYLDLA